MDNLKSFVGEFLKCDSGATLVEMTLIVPLLISLSAGVFEFGTMFQRKLLVEAGLRDGARYAARCDSSFTGLNCESNAQNIAASGTHDGTTGRVAGWAANQVTVAIREDIDTVSAGGVLLYRTNYDDDNTHVRVVRVSTTYTLTGLSLLSYLGIGPLTITAAHEERVIGF